MFAIGCGQRMTRPKFVNLSILEPLLPLSESAHRDAATKSWGTTVDVILCGPIHRWAAGLPRLLVAAHAQCTGVICLASGSVDAVATFFQRFQAAAATSYGKILPEWFPQAFSCLLISSTKLPLRSLFRIPMNPKRRSLLEESCGKICTLEEATARSIGSYLREEKQFIVPPIIFTNDVMKSLMVKANVRDPLIMPSQLHPPMTDEITWRLGKYSNSERGRLFQKPFVYAVYARYLLAFWEHPRSEWVRLTDVFKGALQHQLDRDTIKQHVDENRQGRNECNRHGKPLRRDASSAT